MNLAALGEQWHGLGKGVGNFVYLHLGTGVGMGLVLNGELYRGSTRRRRRGRVHAARGHRSAGPDEPPPRCARRCRERRRGRRDRAEARHVAAADRQEVFDAARAGDAKAGGSWRMEAAADRARVAAVAPVVDPELVILGGGIGGNGDLLLDPVERELRAISPFRPTGRASVLARGRQLYGSVSMALQAAQDQLFDRGRCRPDARKTLAIVRPIISSVGGDPGSTGGGRRTMKRLARGDCRRSRSWPPRARLVAATSPLRPWTPTRRTRR